MTLRLRLMIIIGISFTLLWGATSIWMLLDVRTQFRDALDERLAASANMVAGLIAQLPDAQGNISSLPQSILDVAAKDGVACEIRLIHGGVPARTVGTPKGLSTVRIGYSTRTIDGQQWRSYTLEHEGKRVTTADRVDKRRDLLYNIVFATVFPFVVAILGSLLVLWFGITKGLAPLEAIRQALAEREPNALHPLPSTRVPAELEPLVRTINLLLGRTQSAMERERRFTGDAAHELRTPLTAVKTHLQVARMTAGDNDTVQALTNAESGVQRLQHTLEQLLTLARVEGPFSFENMETVKVSEIIQTATAELGAHDRMNIVQNFSSEQVSVAASRILAATALRNVIENALRYSPAQSPVTIEVITDDENVTFSVMDQGRGLTDAEREEAIRRFWRRGQGQGSGLGLSIVDAIVTRYGGDFKLENRAGQGTTARIRFLRFTSDHLQK
jgi:two-component system sensor histidine kinase QseC